MVLEVHHNLWDTRPSPEWVPYQEQYTRGELIEIGDMYWQSRPVEAAKFYQAVLSIRGYYKDLALFYARAGSIVTVPKYREKYFEYAQVSAKQHEASPEIFTEIDALREWSDRRDAGQEVTEIPAHYVAYILEARRTKVAQGKLAA